MIHLLVFIKITSGHRPALGKLGNSGNLSQISLIAMRLLALLIITVINKIKYEKKTNKKYIFCIIFLLITLKILFTSNYYFSYGPGSKAGHIHVGFF